MCVIKDNSGLVIYIIQKHYPNLKFFRKDLISIGQMALYRADEAYDETKGERRNFYYTYILNAFNNFHCKYVRKDVTLHDIDSETDVFERAEYGYEPVSYEDSVVTKAYNIIKDNRKFNNTAETVFKCVYIDNLTIKQTAKLLNMSKQGIHYSLNSTYRRLKPLINEDDYR